MLIIKQLIALGLAILLTLVFLVGGYYGAIGLLYVWTLYKPSPWLIVAVLVAVAALLIVYIKKRKPAPAPAQPQPQPADEREPGAQ
jgi:uncharacterized membrane protein